MQRFKVSHVVFLLFVISALAVVAARRPADKGQEESGARRAEAPGSPFSRQMKRLREGREEAREELLGRRSLRRVLPGPASRARGRHPFVGPNVLVNDPQQPYPEGLLGRSETTIAASKNGRQLIAGWNDVEGFLRAPFDVYPGPPGLSGFAFSTDGGATWTDGGAPPVIDHILTAGDPWIDRGGADKETYFFSNLAIDDRLPPENLELGVSVHRGHFRRDGFAWEDVRLISPPDPHDGYDKGMIAAAKDGSGSVYLSVTNFRAICGQTARARGQIELWRSHDSGTTWQGPAVVSPDRMFVTDPSDPNCGAEGILQHESTPAVGPGGEVYVVWELGPTFRAGGITPTTEILLARSLDGGASFEAPVRIDTINSMFLNPPVGYNRTLLNDVPQIAVAERGRHKGRVYVTYYGAVAPVTAPPAEQSLTSSQIFLSYSDDRGATWSAPAAITPPVPATGVKQFWPVVSVQADGSVNVVFNESEERQATGDPSDVECVVALDDGMTERAGPVSSLVNTVWVRSPDGGRTFAAPVRLSDATSNWCTAASNIFPNFGDYIGSVSVGERVLSAWTDSRNGVPDVFFGSAQAAGRGR